MQLELLDYQGVRGEIVDPNHGNWGTVHMAFFVDCLDKMCDRLATNGVLSVSRPVTPTIGPNTGGRAVYMVDPDGVRVELIQTAGSFGDYTARQG